MTRCPDTYRPAQHSGRARYRFAGRVMRCVLEEGHEGAHVHEPETLAEECATARAKAVAPSREAAVAQAARAAAGQTRTPDQIAESDARYREHLRRKRRG